MSLQEYEQSFVDGIARQLADTLTNIAGRHWLPEEVYVMISRNDGVGTRLFTAPFGITRLTEGDGPGSVRADRLGKIGCLRQEVAFDVHMTAVLKSHPSMAFVCDQATAETLRQSASAVEWQSEANGHYKLIGLPGSVADVYVEYAATALPPIGDVSGFMYTE